MTISHASTGGETGDATEMRADARKIAVLNMHARTVRIASSRTHRSHALRVAFKARKACGNSSSSVNINTQSGGRKGR